MPVIWKICPFDASIVFGGNSKFDHPLEAFIWVANLSSFVRVTSEKQLESKMDS